MTDAGAFDSHADECMRQLAASLMAMAPVGVLYYPDRLLKSKKITLATAASGPNKNAVVVWPKFVRFMVPDWSIEPSVHSQQIATKRNTLHWMRLEVFVKNAANEHKYLLEELVQVACKESNRRRLRDVVSRRSLNA